MIEGVFLFLIIALAVLWVFDAIQSYRRKKQLDEWQGLVNSFTDSFLEYIRVVNANAATLRTLVAAVDRQEKRMDIAQTVLDIHAHALRLESLSQKLENTTIENLPVGDLNDDTDEGGAEETD